MKILDFSSMKAGWFVGNFEPTAYKTSQFEVCFKRHQKGEAWDLHYHTDVTEINLLVKGKMKFQNRLLKENDIFIVEPYEISDPEFLEDCELVIVKTPSKNDKMCVAIK